MTSHKCKLPSCSQLTEKEWCKFHTCSRPGCKAPSLRCIPIEEYENFRACFQHKCHIDQCGQSIDAREKFCSSHREDSPNDGHDQAISLDAINSANLSILGEQIQTYQKLITLPSDFLEQRTAFVKDLESLIRLIIPDAELKLFGSLVTGLATEDSDVDLCLITKFQESEVELLTKLCKHFGKNHISTNLVNARVPILRFTNARNETFIPKFDLCINNHFAIDNSRYVAICSQYDPRIKSLILIIRVWAKETKLAHPVKGFNSYCQSLLVLFFSQTCNPPLLPWFQPEDCLKEKEFVWPSLKKVNNKSLPQLLLEFFNFLLQFDWQNQAVSLRQGSALLKSECHFEVSPLAVEDPIDITFNCARLPNESFARRMRDATYRSLSSLILGQPATFLQILKPITECQSSELQIKKRNDSHRFTKRIEVPRIKPVSDEEQSIELNTIISTLVPQPHQIEFKEFAKEVLPINTIILELRKALADLLKKLGFYQDNYAKYFVNKGGRAADIENLMTKLYQKYQALKVILDQHSNLNIEQIIGEYLTFYESDPDIFIITDNILNKKSGIRLTTVNGLSVDTCLIASRHFLLKLDWYFTELKSQFENIQCPNIDSMLQVLDRSFQYLPEKSSAELRWIQRQIAPTFNVLSNSLRRLVKEVFVCAINSKVESGQVIATHRCVLFNDVLVFSSLTQINFTCSPVESIRFIDPDPNSSILALRSSGKSLPASIYLFESPQIKADFISAF